MRNYGYERRFKPGCAVRMTLLARLTASLDTRWFASPSVWSYGIAVLVFGAFSFHVAKGRARSGRPAFLLATLMLSAAAASGGSFFCLKAIGGNLDRHSGAGLAQDRRCPGLHGGLSRCSRWFNENVARVVDGADGGSRNPHRRR